MILDACLGASTISFVNPVKQALTGFDPAWILWIRQNVT